MAQESNGFITLYSTKAHVFQINETKSSWVQKGDHAIPISIVASIIPATSETLSKQQLRLIGTDDDKNTVLNATIMPTTVFTKRSQKFGQWIDHTGTLHGLGFNSQEELKEFMDAFQQSQSETFDIPSSYPQPLDQQVHRMQQQQQQQPSTSIGAVHDPHAEIADQLFYNHKQKNNNETSETNGLNQKAGRYNSGTNNVNNMMGRQFNSNTLAHPGHQMKRQQQQQLQNQQQQPQQVLLQQHQLISQSSLNSTSANNAKTNGNLSLNNGMSMENGGANSASAAYPRSQSMFGLQGKPLNNNQKPDIVSLRSGGGAGTPDTENSTCIIQNNDWQTKEQLKYENERLKQALEESSRNAGIWHTELITLRTNNVKLTQALEESKSNVEEWERELTSLTKENKELKLKFSSIEVGKDKDRGNEAKEDLERYKNYAEEELRKKENEIVDLRKSMELLELKAKQQNGHSDESANASQLAHNSIQKQKLEVISAKFGAKISELVNVQKEFGQYLDKLNN